MPYSPGATWDGAGVNFALFSEHATAVELCLFDACDESHEVARIPLPEQTTYVWHCYLPEVRPGQLYGYRVHGPYAPHEGHRFNPHKLLLDPYTKAISGAIQGNEVLFNYIMGHSEEDLSFDKRDSAAEVPKCVVLELVPDRSPMAGE
jgi:glycogen operon protein